MGWATVEWCGLEGDVFGRVDGEVGRGVVRVLGGRLGIWVRCDEMVLGDVWVLDFCCEYMYKVTIPHSTNFLELVL